MSSLPRTTKPGFFADSLLLKILFGAIIASALLHIIWQLIVGPWDPLRFDLLMDIAMRFGLDNELSVPTWLVSAMALATSGVLWLIGRHTTASKLLWYVLAALFAVIAIDETAALHELVVQGVHVGVGLGDQQTFTSNAWLLLAPLIFAAGIWLVVWLHRSLPSKTFWRIAIALGVYVGGAFFVEYLSIQIDKADLMYRIGLVVLEETMEMLGVWLALRAALLHIREQLPDLQSLITRVVYPKR